MDQVGQRGAQTLGMLGLLFTQVAYLREATFCSASNSSALWWISVIISTVSIFHIKFSILFPREAFGMQEWMWVQGISTYVSRKSLPLLGISVYGLLQQLQNPPNTLSSP
jgi:hypothetical protein